MNEIKLLLRTNCFLVITSDMIVKFEPTTQNITSYMIQLKKIANVL